MKLIQPTAQTTTNADGTSTSLIPVLVTTEENAKKKNNVKARSMLLMALPNEHLMTFNQYKDAKTLFAAIQTRFSGNEATKKTQKNLLKQMYENFSAPSTESLDSIFNRLQKIVSQLAILGENISQEDLNLKFLRSLPSEWNTHVVVWRNKPDLDTMSFDDLYNNFKIVEQGVKRTASSSSSSQNMTFVSSLSSTNEVNTAYGVSTANTQVSPASTQVSTASTQVSTANLNDLEEMDLKWQLALLSMRTRRFFQKFGRKITINRSDTAGYDKSKVECFNYHKMGYFARECRGPKNQDSRNRNQDSSRRTVNVEETSSKTTVAIDGASFDWSYMADNEVRTNMDLMAFSDSKFNKSEFNLATYKRGLASVEEQLVFYKKNEVIFCEQLALAALKRDISYNDSEISMLKKKFQQPEFEGYGPKTSKNISEYISNELVESPLAYWLIPVEVFDHVQAYKTAICNYHQREMVVSGNNYTRVNYNYFAKKAHPSDHRDMVPRAVLIKTGLRSLNIARPVNTAHPKTTVYSARPMSHFSKSAQSTVKRPYQIRTALTNKNSSQKVNTAKGKFYTARPNSAVVNAVRENQGHPQKEDQGYVDSGCSRHMTGNMSYLSDFKEFDGGYMCDKKNNVLFTNTGCFVLSPNFKLADESQVLLKVPRKNNMYIVDMKNIVPKESLTCLVAKATLDESMLWH
ncbi:ribonuclease H-like domain-containing protein [Tanacetum coccineum]